MRLIPRQGYLMFLTGFFIGIVVAALISSTYFSRGTTAETTGLPSKVEIVFLYSSEKQSWLEEVTPMFQKWFKEKFGIEVHVVLVPAGTHETVNLMLQGSIKPTIWSPASSIWIPYFNRLWNKTNGEEIALEWYPLVISPIVIAGWSSLVKQYNISSFKDLYQLAKQGVDFKWGHPDPLLSNGGTMVVLLEFAEAAGKPVEELTVEDLLNPQVQEIVKTIESRAVYYGKSTGFFGRWAVDNGPAAISFFGVYENIVIDNAYKAYKKWNDKLVAIYPSHGTLLSDHPFVILHAKWVTKAQKLVASYYLYFLLQPEIQLIAQKHGFRPVNPAVPVDPEIFNERNGVTYSLKVRVFKPPSGEVLEALFKVWEKVKNPGVG